MMNQTNPSIKGCAVVAQLEGRALGLLAVAHAVLAVAHLDLVEGAVLILVVGAAVHRVDPAGGTTAVAVKGIQEVILVLEDGTQMPLGLGGGTGYSRTGSRPGSRRRR